jgi:hypothetical protein
MNATKSRTTKPAGGQWLPAVFVVGFFGAVPGLWAQSPALTLAEVLELRTQGVSSRQILRNAKQYCISFTVDDSIRKQLDAAGADSALVTGLRSTCSTREHLAAPALPSDVVLNDDFSRGGGRGGFKLGDRRCSVHADSTALRLENRARDIVCVTGYPSDPLDDNVRIELTVNRLGANRQGLVVLGFGRDPDLVGQYSLSVTADRRVELCRTDGAACQRLVYRTGIAAVKTGAADENRIAVEVRGRRITVIINGQTIDSYTTNRNVSGALSLGVGPGTNVDVTHVVARRLAATPESK